MLFLLSIFLTLPKLTTANLTNFNLNQYQFNEFALYSKLFSKYSEFYLIGHFENHTKHLINHFLSNHKNPAVIYNYDNFSQNFIKRPQTTQCLNIVFFFNPTRIASYLKNSANIKHEDIIIFLLGPSSFQIFSKSYETIPNLSKFGRVILIKYSRIVELFYVSFYKGGKSGIKFLEKLQRWESTKLPQEFYPKKFKNFYGHTLQVAYVDYFPYIYCTKKKIISDKIYCEDALGSDYELLKILSKKLNFRFLLIQSPNSSYGQIFRGLQEEEFDLAIGGLSLNSQRLKLLQFSRVLKLEEIAVIYKHEHSVGQLFVTIIKPSLQITLGVVHLLVTLLIVWMLRRLQLKPVRLFFQIFEILARICFEQPVPIYARSRQSASLALYIIWTSWWLFWTVININIRSKLTSTFIATPRVEYSLAKLLEQGRRIVTDHSLTQVYLDLFSDEEMALILKAPIVRVGSICEVLELLETRNYIIVGEVSRSLFYSKVFCAAFNQLKHVSVQKFQVTRLAWPFKSGAPFVDAFNVEIKQIIDGGLFKVWFNNVLLKKKLGFSDTAFDENLDRVINFASFSKQVFVYLIMNGICTLCFLGEILYYYWRKKRGMNV